MAINFPTSLDNFTNPSSGNTLDSPSHSLQHSDINDAVEALEAKLGVGVSPAGSASAGQVLTISAAGTSTWSTPTTPGMVLLTTTTFTTASAVSLPNDSFTSTYANYFWILRYTTTAGGEMRFRGLTAGTPNTTANYVYQGTEANATSLAGFRATGQTSGYVAYTDGVYSNLLIDIIDPKTTQPTGVYSRVNRSYNGTPLQMLVNNGFTATTSFDSAQVFPSGGTMSGVYYLYAYNQ